MRRLVVKRRSRRLQEDRVKSRPVSLTTLNVRMRRMTMMKLKGKQSTKEDQDPATGIQGGAYLLR